MRGALTIEQDLPAGTKLWLSAWSKQISGADFISISAEIAVGGPRKRPTTAESRDDGHLSARSDGHQCGETGNPTGSARPGKGPPATALSNRPFGRGDSSH
jgi:hypothetical protein